MHIPARPPSPPARSDIERRIVIQTANAPKMSKFKRSQRVVIQNEYSIYVVLITDGSISIMLGQTFVVVSILR